MISTLVFRVISAVRSNENAEGEGEGAERERRKDTLTPGKRRGKAEPISRWSEIDDR